MLKIYRVLGKKGRITIPYEIRQRIGFRYNDVLSFIQQDDGSVLVRREKICDNCKYLEEDFEENINALMKSISDGGSYEIVTAMVNNLDEILNDEFK